MTKRIAVIGAGMAGLACAQVCVAAGLAVRVYDKGRRPGGRLATRRAGGAAFDHGAQYATAPGPAFARFIAAAADTGHAAIWPLEGGSHPRWVGLPGMSGLAQAMVDSGVGEILTGRHVAWLQRDGAFWRLRHHPAQDTAPGLVTAEGGVVDGPFDAIVLAIPSIQAEGLLRGIGHPLAAVIAPVVVAPCWTLMLTFDQPQPGQDAATLTEGPLAWIARNASRPGRAPRPDAWVAHASPSWSRTHLERSAELVLPELRAAFAASTGIDAAPAYAAVHRWRYAQTETPLGRLCLWDPASSLAVCGDWCLGARVEAAFDSGQAAAACMA